MTEQLHADSAAVEAADAAAPDASPLAREVARRRTFAIISHPDAGKTTLTEKLLLFGGAIQLAGQVKAKRDRRQTRSDWMAIERERGISVVTSVIDRKSTRLNSSHSSISYAVFCLKKKKKK